MVREGQAGNLAPWCVCSLPRGLACQGISGLHNPSCLARLAMYGHYIGLSRKGPGYQMNGDMDATHPH